MNGTPAALEARTGAPKHLRAVVSADGLSSILSTACSSESASPVEASMIAAIYNARALSRTACASPGRAVGVT
jgi:hypothetical protein